MWYAALDQNFLRLRGVPTRGRSDVARGVSPDRPNKPLLSLALHGFTNPPMVHAALEPTANPSEHSPVIEIGFVRINPIKWKRRAVGRREAQD